MKNHLDAMDWSLLVSLQKNGRASFRELAEEVGLTPPAVSERIRKLEEAGYIRGYRAVLDLERIGYAITAIVRLAVPSGKQCPTLLELLAEIPEVLEAYRVTGTDSAIVKAAVSSSDHLESLIDRLTLLGKPTTSIATSTFERQPAITGPAETIVDWAEV